MVETEDGYVGHTYQPPDEPYKPLCIGNSGLSSDSIRSFPERSSAVGSISNINSVSTTWHGFIERK